MTNIALSEVSSFGFEVEPLPALELKNGEHPFVVEQWQLTLESQRALPEDAPEVLLGFTNGFLERAATFAPLSEALIGAAACNQVKMRTFALTAPESYCQEQHTDDATIAFQEMSDRGDQKAYVVGHSRGSITAASVHTRLQDHVKYSLNVAPPGCDAMPVNNKGLLTATMAVRSIREARHSMLHLLRPDGWRDFGHGTDVLLGLVSYGAGHIFGEGLESLTGTVDEIHEIVKNEKFKFMDMLVALDEATEGQTGVVICDKDALCLPAQSAANLRKAGYNGLIEHWENATHLDLLSRPNHYAGRLFELLDNEVGFSAVA
jgi:predicted alpha/beta hydrolase family esterase